jgi:superfamily I DNA and RNA helicase
LGTELAKAKAKEQVFAQAEIELPESSAWNIDLEENTNELHKDSDQDSERTLNSSVSSINPMLSTKPEIECKILQQQNCIMEKLVTQQQRSILSDRDMFTFDGDLTKYRTFICAFDTLIEAKEPDYASKLYYLEQYVIYSYANQIHVAI